MSGVRPSSVLTRLLPRRHELHLPSGVREKPRLEVEFELDTPEADALECFARRHALPVTAAVRVILRERLTGLSFGSG